jgi:hypothetical protein
VGGDLCFHGDRQFRHMRLGDAGFAGDP